MIAGSPDYIRTMRPAIPVLLVVLAACQHSGDSLCERFYQPYPDFISQRERTSTNAELLDAMRSYDHHDYAKAAEGLRAVIDKQDDDPAARMYLASALLGAGDPYKAEMHLDFLERSANQNFKDQVEWYDALCWLCSGQNDRALKQCEWISSQPRHTYKQEARALYVTLVGK